MKMSHLTKVAKFEIKIPCIFPEFKVNKLCYKTDILNYLCSFPSN